MTLTQVRLARDCLDTPWGFRLQGGKDFENQPLTVQRVFANTPSERELHRGDVIITINGRDVSGLTHKQAQDAISRGGQIEFLVQRPPPGQVHIKPLSPNKEVRAPTFPQSPVKAPQIVIPIQRRRSGPPSPTRVIPISPQKPAPPKTSPKPSPKPKAQSQPPSEQHSSPMAGAAGHIPTKVTMNRYGGGTMNFGTSFGSPPAPQYRPVAAPQATHQQASQPTYQAAPQPTYQQAPQPTYQAAPQPTYQQAPAQSQDQYDYSYQQSQSQTQFSAPQMSPQMTDERGVEEEEYGGVRDRRKLFLQGTSTQQHFPDDDDDYPTTPVYERRRMFGKKPDTGPAVRRSHKPLPTFGRPRIGEEPVSYGVDYTKPHTMQQKTSASKTSSKPRQRPPPVNSHDETDMSWSGTLKGDRRHLKPWELEALEAEKYQHASADQPYRPSMAPAPAPKPKITQIITESRAKPAEQRSVSPYYSAPPHPGKSPSRSPAPHSQTPGALDVAGDQQGAPNIVHLQYNSPMGLYSQDNIRDTYVGQTQGRAQPAPGGKKQPVPIGDRDWNDSYVYQMVHSSQKTTSSSRQDGPGHAPQGETVTTTRTAHETRYPGQEPQRHVTETVERGGVPDYRYNAAIGMSDF